MSSPAATDAGTGPSVGSGVLSLLEQRMPPVDNPRKRKLSEILGVDPKHAKKLRKTGTGTLKRGNTRAPTAKPVPRRTNQNKNNPKSASSPPPPSFFDKLGAKETSKPKSPLKPGETEFERLLRSLPEKKRGKRRQVNPTSRLMPRLKTVKAPPLSEWMRRLRKETRTIIGIDMSLSNPGLCVMDPTLRTIHLYCFRNRKKETVATSYLDQPGSPFHHWLVEVTILEDPVNHENGKRRFDFSLFRFERYENRIQALMAVIGDNRKKNKLVGIEGYSFKSKATQAETALKELGGCLRRSLCHFQHEIMELPPSTVKKIFSGVGKSDKNEMYRCYRETYRLPDLFKCMNIAASDQVYLDDPEKNIPHPIEDMVDALAVALSLLFLVP